MDLPESREKKVVIVGAGAVGSTFAYALAQSGVAEDIVLVEPNQELFKGQVLDLAHGLPFFPTVKITNGSSSDFLDAHVIVITAGVKQASGEPRLNLLRRNAEVIEWIADEINAQKSHAVIVIATNPVDLLTYVMSIKLGLKPGRVIGSGTVLDSARFRYLLSQRCGVDVHNIHAYILGEHGDSEFAAWSMSHIAGIRIDQYCTLCRQCNDGNIQRQNIVREVMDSAYHIIDYKGATSFSIGLDLVQITTAILRNQHSVLSVSTLLNGAYSLHDICLSVPCIISQQGVERVIEGELTEEERQALVHSASVLRKTYTEFSSS
jgi:L-lactate dehydrogenase